MKTRNGFVSNSSSSSFVISKDNLSRKQIVKIKNHMDVNLEINPNAWEYYRDIYDRGGMSEEDIDKEGMEYYKSQAWSIHETEKYLDCYTSMDNFDLRNFVISIGVDEKDIKDRWHSND